MAGVNLKVSKGEHMHPRTKVMGYSARVARIGTADYEEVVAEACRNTTLNKAEAKIAFELCIDTVVRMLKRGFIVDLGPLGKLYPSCTGKWAEKEEDLQLSSLRPKLYYRPGREISAAFKSAKLEWEKGSESAADKDGSEK